MFKEAEENEKEFEELNFKFYLILIDLSLNLDGHTWLTVTWDRSRGLIRFRLGFALFWFCLFVQQVLLITLLCLIVSFCN